MADTNEELKRIEDELLAEEPQDIDKLIKEFLEEPEPAFDDPDKTEISDEPVVYCNYSNDYGKEQKKEDEDAALAKKKKDDNIIITLLAVAAGLSVGIIGVLVYWLVKYL
ncbi:MAG: hypothetical protein IJO72_03360 [Oscillospiraceae bacterium]|nr:hypothetical protein [Oscillospiraceae bacterium]MBQ9929797.1 hypothetical protein [Oscillospiraceae bacterium]